MSANADSKPKPEKRIGPFANGVGVAIWLNTVETDDGGTRQFRSITVNPRRYLDRITGEWKDAPSFQPADLPALIFSLEKAQEYVFEQPLPGAEQPQAGGESTPPSGEPGQVPF